MSSIPASQLVQVVPSVLAAGGNALAITGLVLTTSSRVPIGTVASFPNALAVSNFFGPTSKEAGIAAVYFAGFTGADALPGSILFSQYNPSAVSAYLQGASVAAMTLSQLQALSGSLDIVVDGYPRNAATINLAGSASFSAAAASIQASLNAGLADTTEANFTASIGASFTGVGSGTSLTVSASTGLLSAGDTVSGTAGTVPANTTIVSQISGTTGGNGVYQTSNATTANGALTTATNTLKVTVVASGALAVGQTVLGTGVVAATITSQLSGSVGGSGTYVFGGAQQGYIASEAMTSEATPLSVTFDSVSSAFVITSGTTGAPSTIAYATGTLAASLFLTLVTGAVLSQGAAAAATPAAYMNTLIQVTANWVTFMTAFDPDFGAGNTVKQAFAAWKNTALGGNRFCYVCWDTDITPSLSVPASTSLGNILEANGDSGTCLVWEPSDLNLAPFVMGAAASINFTEPNGHISFAYKAQAGLVAGVTNGTVAQNLGGNPQTNQGGNGYNFYGAYGAANISDTWFQRGTVTGAFTWLDAYIEQIYFNALFQAALLQLQANAKSIPYTANGSSLLEGALAGPIQQMLSFGACAPGPLSPAQVQEVNQAAGANIANTLQTQGYYLQILPASAAVRNARTSPPCTFWYISSGSIQSISLASISLL